MMLIRIACWMYEWIYPSFPAFRLGPVHRGQFGEALSFLRPTVHTIPECPRFPGTITADWFWLCVRSPCTLDENSCAISITSPRSLSPQHFVPGPNMFGGTTGRSPGERPHYGIAGPGKWDLVWTRGLWVEYSIISIVLWALFIMYSHL